jgi:hypothetical protein
LTGHLYVKLEQDDDGYPPYTSEELDATLVEEDLWAIDRAPAWAYGISRSDVVRVQRDHDSSLWITEVVQPSSNWCARVKPRAEVRDSSVVDLFKQLGADVWPTRFGLVVVDVSGDVPPTPIMDALQDGVENGSWYFDLGVGPNSS